MSPTEEKDNSPSCPTNNASTVSQAGNNQRTFSQSLKVFHPRLKEGDINAASQGGSVPNSPRTSTDIYNGGGGPLSPDVTDRVFPMRSVVSVDPMSTPLPTPYIRSDGHGDGFPGMTPARESITRRQYGSDEQSIAAIDSLDQALDRSTVEIPTRTPGGRSQGILCKDYALDNDNSMADLRMKTSESIQSGAHRMGGGVPLQTTCDDVSLSSNSDASVRQGIGLKSNTGSIRSVAASANGLVTARFKHVITNGGHAIITGRDGDTLQRCEDEPIHIPGAIQGFGLLIALSEDAEGKLTVRVVSENSKRIIGYTPKQLFELDSFCDILSEEQADNLIDHLDFIREDDSDPATHGPEVFILAIRPPTGRVQKLWCAMHINTSNPGIIICEFELEDDVENPLVPHGEATPEPPENTLQANPTEEEIAESTFSTSKPLRVLRSARKRKGEAAAMEVFNIMSQIQEQLANAPSLDMFLKVLVGIVKELTGFHRVMVYQFDHDWNGRVVTELVDPRATKDLFKGLNFPASDIPKQARDLYKINKVRLLYDRDQVTARLVCRTVEDLEIPLDLTYAYLRAISPIHIKYLCNMAVRSSMSISINAFGELWGLISCHSYGTKGMRVSFPIRKMCRLLGDLSSRNIERLSYASRLQARKLINTISTEQNPSGYIIASSDDLLKLFDADYGLLSIRDETKMLGKLEQTQEALAMLEYLRLRKITSVLTSQDIRVDFPDLRYPPGFSILAGLLYVPLSVGGTDFIVFFRKGQLREVKWAGNPYEKFIKEGTEGYLEPRKSFKTWSETVVGKCQEWSEEQIETAAVLCLVYGKFIEVWREKEAALQNSQLTKLLLANSAHEVRTPLNAIINYLEIAMEGTLDTETRENLSRSHSASKSLIYVINDLLDLTKTEEGKDLVKGEVFDLPATVREATDIFKGDAKRKNIDYTVSENPGVPQFVIGDQRKVRQAISNITANAIQHTYNGSIKVELWLAGSGDGHVEVDIVIEDTGTGMSASKLDALFRDLEQVQTENDEQLQEAPPAGSTVPATGNSGKRTIGLGLAIVARIIRNMNGQMRLKSEEGTGSRFVIQLGFTLPAKEDNKGILQGAKEAGIDPPRGQPSTPPIEEGEVFLVNKSAQKPIERLRKGLSRHSSDDSVVSTRSVNSMKSAKSVSSVRSDVDRLIAAIQEPHMVQKTISSEPRIKGSGSRSSLHDRSSSMKDTRPMMHIHTLSGLSNHSAKLAQFETDAILGQASMTNPKPPIKPVRVPEDAQLGDSSGAAAPRSASRILSKTRTEPHNQTPPTADHFSVLVAEDDPINSRIVKKRLEKYGHVVCLTINGEECASAYGENPTFFDVVLMDMQVLFMSLLYFHAVYSL